MSWPDDADGDVLRRLEADNFDFSKEYSVDFNVDFDKWPPPQEAVNILKTRYTNMQVIDPDKEDLEEGEFNGYIVFQLTNRISYEFVTKTQTEVTRLVRRFGGLCESWGVMTD
jgi:hypothetical protein